VVVTFIFDFDGTIADSLEAIVAITNRLAPRFGYEPRSPAEVAYLKDLHTRQLLQQSGLSCCSLLWLLRRVRQDLQQEIPYLQPFPGMGEVLSTLHRRGYRLGILTSNTADNVHLFLSLHGLSSLFDFVYTGATLLGKQRSLRRVLHRYCLDPATTFYVGDEVRDIEAAQQTGIQPVAVTWGFNSAAVLAEQQPSFLVSDPQQLLAIADAL